MRTSRICVTGKEEVILESSFMKFNQSSVTNLLKNPDVILFSLSDHLKLPCI